MSFTSTPDQYRVMSAESRAPKYPILDDIEVPEKEIENWQTTIDMLAKIADVPAALIMRVHRDEIEVLVSSQSYDNVYHTGAKESLDSGLYCEMVMDTKDELLVPNALKDQRWEKNPDIKLGMISYCGLPLTWPGGRLFGTICILDKQENTHSQLIRDLLARLRDSIQFSLKGIYDAAAERKRAEHAEELASRDSLTKLYNHGMFFSLLEEEIARAERHNRPVSLLMLDVDHFKRVNDTRGHQAGDTVLKGLSDLLAKQARRLDRVCRYGGEEITVILPETEVTEALSIAERLRANVERQPFNFGEGNTISITVSIGVATYPHQVNSLDGLVQASDIALYAAKRGGRNRVCGYVAEISMDKSSA